MKRRLLLPLAALMLMLVGMSSCYVGPGYYHRGWGRPHYYHHHYHGGGYYRY